MLCLKDALIKDSVLHMVKQIAVTDYLHAEWDIEKIIKPSSKWINLDKKKHKFDSNVIVTWKVDDSSWGICLVAMVIPEQKVSQHLFVLPPTLCRARRRISTDLLEIAWSAWGVSLWLPSVQTTCTQSYAGSLAQTCSCITSHRETFWLYDGQVLLFS